MLGQLKQRAVHAQPQLGWTLFCSSGAEKLDLRRIVCLATLYAEFGCFASTAHFPSKVGFRWHNRGLPLLSLQKSFVVLCGSRCRETLISPKSRLFPKKRHDYVSLPVTPRNWEIKLKRRRRINKNELSFKQKPDVENPVSLRGPGIRRSWSTAFPMSKAEQSKPLIKAESLPLFSVLNWAEIWFNKCREAPHCLLHYNFTETWPRNCGDQRRFDVFSH